VRLQAIEYLNISGLVIDFATSPVRTGNSFFAAAAPSGGWHDDFLTYADPARPSHEFDVLKYINRFYDV